MATCGGAQVALQQRLILRPGNKQFIKNLKGRGVNFGLSRGVIFRLSLALILPWANTEMMNIFLRQVAEDFSDYFTSCWQIRPAGIYHKNWKYLKI